MSSHAHTEGTLYLLPVWLGDAGGPEMLAPAVVEVAERVRLFFAEDERTARRMLRRMSPTIVMQELEMHRLDKDTSPEEVESHVHLLRGREGAVISEAGMPAIADPGARLVAAAHHAGIRVVPLPGPSSILLALAASGLNGQHFTFHGYLPREQQPRRQALRELEQLARRTGGAQLFMETPYRNDALLGDILRTVGDQVLLCIAKDIGQPQEMIRTRTIGEWRKAGPVLGKCPAVFILGTPAT
ncbi:MAG: SAM-dependent methyltransferase [Flavobacteriales bacterium]|nr:SAM-dependent methyltransferase [Flavobacteriales bacterium]